MNILERLGAFPDEERVKNVCRKGKGEETCRFLSSSGKWICQKNGVLKEEIDILAKEGQMKAQGDNCDGIVEILKEMPEELKGLKVEYIESFPPFQEEGTLIELDFNWGEINDFFVPKWKDERDNLQDCPRINMSNLLIQLSRNYLIFSVMGLGAISGELKVFLE